MRPKRNHERAHRENAGGSVACIRDNEHIVDANLCNQLESFCHVTSGNGGVNEASVANSRKLPRLKALSLNACN